jgi:hypothetical protein
LLPALHERGDVGCSAVLKNLLSVRGDGRAARRIRKNNAEPGQVPRADTLVFDSGGWPGHNFHLRNSRHRKSSPVRDGSGSAADVSQPSCKRFALQVDSPLEIELGFTGDLYAVARECAPHPGAARTQLLHLKCSLAGTPRPVWDECALD